MEYLNALTVFRELGQTRMRDVQSSSRRGHEPLSVSSGGMSAMRVTPLS